MNLPRIFAQAFARRVAYVIVGALALFLSQCFGEAYAADNIEQAYAKCKTAESDTAAQPGWVVGTSCAQTPGSTAINGNWVYYYGREGPGYNPNQYGSTFQYTSGCVLPEVWDDTLKQCSECPAGGESVTFPSALGAYRCPSGQCPQTGLMCSGSNGGAAGYVCWVNVGGSKCGDDEPCPEGMTKGADGICHPPTECPEGTTKDENGQCAPPHTCPEGQTKDQFGLCKPNDGECPAGQVKGPDGACVPDGGNCPAGKVRGKDGTCKADADGDGNPDDEDGDGNTEDGEGTGDDESTFSGGDNCNAPPTCAGDNIMCGQAQIQWRIDCNTRKNALISGGQCNQPPTCTGDGCKPLDQAILITTWRTACALEAQVGTGTPGDGGQPAWTKVDGMSTDPSEGEGEGDAPGITERELSVDDIDQGGWTGGGSCMGFMTLSGQGIASGFAASLASPPPYFCDYIAILKAILILGAGVVCATMLAKGV